MGAVIDIKTRRSAHAKDLEGAAGRHGALHLEKAIVPSDPDPIIEAVMLRLQNMDEEGKRAVLRRAIKLRNARPRIR
jgi:hypothetical protein